MNSTETKMPLRNRQWIYRTRPEGVVSSEHYKLVETPIDPMPAAQELIVRAHFISVDPYMRIQQAARNTWEEPHPLGIVQRAGVVAQVIAAGADVTGFAPGDFVLTYTGWQELARCHPLEVTKLDPDLAPVSTALGVLGMPGRTAWFGLMEAGRPKPGETVVVSGTAGAVGSLVVQFAKRAGCRVVGIAGGKEKCDFVRARLGAHEAVDYRRFGPNDWREFSAELARVCGGESRVDVYFDNVGGLTTDGVLPQLALRARIVICGQISQYGGGLDERRRGRGFCNIFSFNAPTFKACSRATSLRAWPSTCDSPRPGCDPESSSSRKRSWTASSNCPARWNVCSRARVAARCLSASRSNFLNEAW